MKIYLNRVIISFLIVVSSFLMFFIINRESYMLSVCFCTISLLMVLSYFNNVIKNKSIFLFLICYFLAEFITVIFHDLKSSLDILVNAIYCMAYLSLLVFVIKTINFNELWRRFKTGLVILIIVSGVIVYNMNDIMLDSKTIDVVSYKFMLDTINNIIVIVLLCLSFLNFMHSDTKISLLVFLICLSLVFSEVIQLAYIYIAKYYTFFVLLAAFKLIGFCICFYYLQVKKNVLYGILS